MGPLPHMARGTNRFDMCWAMAFGSQPHPPSFIFRNVGALTALATLGVWVNTGTARPFSAASRIASTSPGERTSEHVRTRHNKQWFGASITQLSFNWGQLAFCSCTSIHPNLSKHIQTTCTAMHLGPQAPKTLLETVGVGHPVNMASTATPFPHWPSTPRDVGQIHSAGPANRYWTCKTFKWKLRPSQDLKKQIIT